jgi:hypothetical protein
MENNVRYQVVTGTYRVIASGFYTYDGACRWADNHDYGQFEEDGGLMIISYQE